jgi:hypothetical protein
MFHAATHLQPLNFSQHELFIFFYKLLSLVQSNTGLILASTEYSSDPAIKILTYSSDPTIQRLTYSSDPTIQRLTYSRLHCYSNIN